MRNAMIVLLVISSIGLLGFAPSVPPSLLAGDAPALEISTSIRPVTEDAYQLLRRAKPGMDRCSTDIRVEGGNAPMWGTKDIVLGAGERGEEKSTLGSLQAIFSAKINKSLDRAETTVTVTRDGRVISRQRSTVSLAKSPNAVQPLH